MEILPLACIRHLFADIDNVTLLKQRTECHFIILTFLVIKGCFFDQW